VRTLGGIGSCANCGSMTWHGKHVDADLERSGRFCDLAVILEQIRQLAGGPRP
jgi:hypothetical protein